MQDSKSIIPKLLLRKQYLKEQVQLKIHVLTQQQIQNNSQLLQKNKNQYTQKGITTRYRQNHREVYISPKYCSKYKIQQSCQINFSQKVTKLSDFIGVSTELILSAYQFCRKTSPQQQIYILVNNQQQLMNPIFSLIESKNWSRQLANGRGDIQGSPQFILKQIQSMKDKYHLKTTVFKGQQLLKQGFRLLHAVGRASSRQPIFANISYNGNPHSNQYIAFVGKGVCFDSGGLDVKTPEGMKTMFLDKQGACSVLAAFKQIVQEKLPLNLTCSVGLVQNFIGSKSYRPSDIIKSRKGFTVKIDDTDAEGRLILADAMHWTQQNYKVKVLIQLSTLTYSNIAALGIKYAGLFTNSQELHDKLFKLSKITHQFVWRMPVDSQHHQLIDCKQADFVSDNTGIDVPGGSIGAAFLQKFVQKNVEWAHLDIGGVGIVNETGTGWGTILLIEYLRSKQQPLKAQE